jgi:probable F420-dependent oxidoreductase
MVKLGFQLPNSGPLATAANIIDLGRKAEALAYHSVVVTDHVVVPWKIESRYPYNESGRFIVPADGNYFEPLTLLSFVAGATSRLRVGTSVLVVPYRNPVLSAKMLATMDALSNGRLFVGVGGGWLAEEFVALGSPPFADRGRVTDEWLEIFVKLWTEPKASFIGRFYSFDEVGCFPQPVQKPYPPIYVGGNSRPALRRAAKYGQSWHAFRVPARELPAKLNYLEEQRAACGRNTAGMGFSVRYGVRIVAPGADASRRPGEDPERVFVGDAAQVLEQLKPIWALGPTDAIFDCRTGSFTEVVETMERLAGEVYPRLEQ